MQKIIFQISTLLIALNLIAWITKSDLSQSLTNFSAGKSTPAKVEDDANYFSMLFTADTQYPWVNNMNQSEANIKSQSENFMNAHVNSMKSIINQNTASPVKGLIVNGDLTAFGRKETLDKVLSYYNNVTVPLFLGLGNHDIANNVDDMTSNDGCSYMINFMASHILSKTKTGFDYTFASNKHTGSLAYSWEINNIHFVQLHNYPAYEYNWSGTPNGSVTQQTYDIKSAMNWLENDLNQARKAGKGIILNMHDLGDHFSATNTPTAYAQFTDIVSKYEVAAIFIGHIHNRLGNYFNIGNTPVYYCGNPFNSNYLLVDFKTNKMDITKVVNSTKTLAYANVNIPVAAKTLTPTNRPAGVCTAYSPNSDGKVIEFSNASAYKGRICISYLDAQKNWIHWYGMVPLGGSGVKAWLPTGSTNVNMCMSAFLDPSKVRFTNLNIGNNRSACIKLKGTYDSANFEFCGDVPAGLNYIACSNKGAFSAKYEISVTGEDDYSYKRETDDVLAGQKRTLYFSGTCTSLSGKIVGFPAQTKTFNNPTVNTCYKHSGIPTASKFEMGCDSPGGDNYVTFVNKGAYTAAITITTTNGTVVDSGDVLTGQTKTVNFSGAATNLTAKIKVLNKQIASIANPGINTCYKSTGTTINPAFAEGCN